MLCLGVDDEQAESLYIKIRGQTNVGDVVVSVNRVPHQVEVD